METEICCEEQILVQVVIYKKDLKAYLEGKNVEVPLEGSKRPTITFVSCDSCKKILSEGSVELLFRKQFPTKTSKGIK